MDTFDLIWFDFIAPNIMRKQKGKECQIIRASDEEVMSTKIQEVTSNVTITKKKEKQFVRLQLSIPRTQGTFSDKVAPDNDGFTDEQTNAMFKL